MNQPDERWRYRVDFHRAWFYWTWTLSLFEGAEMRWIQHGCSASRRRSQKQVNFWIRLGIRKFAITEHVRIETGQWRWRRSRFTGRRR